MLSIVNDILVRATWDEFWKHPDLRGIVFAIRQGGEPSQELLPEEHTRVMTYAALAERWVQFLDQSRGIQLFGTPSIVTHHALKHLVGPRIAERESITTEFVDDLPAAIPSGRAFVYATTASALDKTDLPEGIIGPLHTFFATVEKGRLKRLRGICPIFTE